MDGFETTRKLLKLYQDNGLEKPYIVALTGHSENNPVVVKKCLESGMDDCQSKPIGVENLKKIFVKANIL